MKNFPFTTLFFAAVLVVIPKPKILPPLPPTVADLIPSSSNPLAPNDPFFSDLITNRVGLSAYFPAFTDTNAHFGMFQSSTDLVNWQAVLKFTYPMDGGTVQFLFDNTNRAIFYRASAQ